MNVKTKGFALELADLLEKHRICITAPNTDPENKIFSYVNFIARGRSESLMPKLQRCHVSSYDLRCETGMSSSEANELYQSNEQVNKGEFVPKANKPVYTQAMCDAGELPSVGVECLVKKHFQDEEMYLKCFIVGLNKKGDYLVFDHQIRGLEQGHIANGVYNFKPITPPIKLIDGEAYQFDCKWGECLGYYEKELKLFNCAGSFVKSADCTNIKLLTVKDEE